MFYSLKNRLGRFAFARRCAGVLETPPVSLDHESRFALLSQIQHKDLLMYLLAVKTFALQLRPQAVYIVDDGTLTSDDRDTLRRHIPGHRSFKLAEFRSAKCPRGGTWERLLAISSLVKDHYIIQLDADTLTLGSIDEVRDCIASSRAFTIGTWDDQVPETMKERYEVASKLACAPKAHIQVVAEASTDRLQEFESMRYIRGCSGFSGFPRGSFSQSDVEQISEQMHSALGARWSEWGTEQFTSNLIVANTSNPAVLPHPKYCDCTQLRGEPVFVHFIGTCRFSDGKYRRLGRRGIASLKHA